MKIQSKVIFYFYAPQKIQIIVRHLHLKIEEKRNGAKLRDGILSKSTKCFAMLINEILIDCFDDGKLQTNEKTM